MSDIYTFTNPESSAAFYRAENIANYYYWLTADLESYLEEMGDDLKDQNLEVAIERYNDLVLMEHQNKTFWKEVKAKHEFMPNMLAYMDNLQLQSKACLEMSKPAQFKLFTKYEDVAITRSLERLEHELQYINQGYLKYADRQSIDYLLTQVVRDFELLAAYQFKALFLERLPDTPDEEFIRLFEGLLKSFSNFLLETKYLRVDKYKKYLRCVYDYGNYGDEDQFEEYLDRNLRLMASWEFVIKSYLDTCQVYVNPHEVEYDEDIAKLYEIASDQLQQTNIEYFSYLASLPSTLDIELLRPLKDVHVPHRKFEQILTGWRSAYGI